MFVWPAFDIDNQEQLFDKAQLQLFEWMDVRNQIEYTSKTPNQPFVK